MPTVLSAAGRDRDEVRVELARQRGPVVIALDEVSPTWVPAVARELASSDGDTVVAVRDGVVVGLALTDEALRRLEPLPDARGLFTRRPEALEAGGLSVRGLAVAGRAPLAVRARARLARLRSPAAPPDPHSFLLEAEADAELASTLDSLDGATNYRDWIVAMMAPHLGPTILEIGAGHGTMTARLVEFGTVTANDLSDRCLAVLRQRFEHDGRVRVVAGDVDEALGDQRFDSIVLVNVLEHIADDAAALERLRSRLNPGGTLVLWVPAFDELYSRMDAAVGHHRRYRRGPLVSLTARAGFDVVEARYVNPVGMAAWYVVATRLGLTPTRRASVDLFDRAVVPVVRRAEHRWRPPLGQSVLLIGRV